MDAVEKELADLCAKDTYLEEQMGTAGLEGPLCFARVTALRSKTDLLGSVDAVEAHFSQAVQGMVMLGAVAGALSTASRTYVSTAAALKAAKKKERQALEKERLRLERDQEKDAEKLRKLQEKLDTNADAENGSDGDPKRLSVGSSSAPPSGKKRRAPAHAAFANTDPSVLSSSWGPDAPVSVVDTIVPWLQWPLWCCWDMPRRIVLPDILT